MPDRSSTRRNHLWRKGWRKCHWCGIGLAWKLGRPNTLTCDHVQPLSKGGTHKRINLVAACMTCNQKKGAAIWA